jgi:RND superfamily putative drug exporter
VRLDGFEKAVADLGHDRVPGRRRAGKPRGEGGEVAIERDDRLRVASYPGTGDTRFVSRDGRTTFALVFKPFRGELAEPLDVTPAITRPLERELPAGTTVRITGIDQLTTGAEARGSGLLAETLLGGLGALGVLALVFGSLLALVPLVLAGVAILSTFLLIVGSPSWWKSA